MKILLLLTLSCLTMVLAAQTLTEKQNKILIDKYKNEQPTLASHIDSLCKKIDSASYFRIETDSVAVHDIADPNNIIGLVIEKIYWIASNKIAKAEMSDYRGAQQIFYFENNFLIKAICHDLSKNEYAAYYYTEEDNKINRYFMYRISECIPELKVFYNNLAIGTAYIKQKMK
jgi:hypothetical protein